MFRNKVGDKDMGYFQKLQSIIPAIAFVIILLSFAIPYGFPLGLPFLIITLLFLIIRKKMIIINFNFELVMLYIVIFFYFWGIFLNDNGLYNENISDLKVMVSVILICLILALLNKKEFEYFILLLIKGIVFSSFFIAVFGLIKYKLLVNGIEIEFLYISDYQYPKGTSLRVDYNMFSYSLFFGLIASFFELKLTKNNYYKIFLVSNIIFIVLTILLAGSRRAWVVLILLFIITLIFSVQLIKRHLNKKSFLALLIAVVGLFIFLSIIPLNDLNNNQEIQRLKYRFSTIQEGGFSERTQRWNEAINIYSDEFSLTEKVFGSGFNYLIKYPEINSLNIKEDYPHNPLLSALLYSGVIGLIFSFILLFIPFLLIKKFNPIFQFEALVLYVISLMYILISGNSVFSNKLFMSYLLIILFSSVQKKEQKMLLLKINRR